VPLSGSALYKASPNGLRALGTNLTIRQHLVLRPRGLCDIFFNLTPFF
jgi:hypothetical protein